MLISLDDERAKKLAKVLSSKTAQKIINQLAEKDSSEQDLAQELKVPINTIEYNLKNLIDAEIIEKSRNFFWSQKGKKIVIYKLSNKSIIISPKASISSKIKSILPALAISFVGALAVYGLTLKEKVFDVAKETQNIAPNLMAGASEASQATSGASWSFPIWSWFLAGALLVLILFTTLNWRKL